MKQLAEYRCFGCGNKWSTWIEGGSLPLEHPHSVECSKCGHVWFKWLNFEEMFGSRKS